MEKNQNDKFSIDFEEIILLRSRTAKLNSVLDSILGIIDRVLESRKSSISELDRDALKNIKVLIRKARS